VEFVDDISTIGMGQGGYREDSCTTPTPPEHDSLR